MAILHKIKIHVHALLQRYYSYHVRHRDRQENYKIVSLLFNYWIPFPSTQTDLIDYYNLMQHLMYTFCQM